MDGSHVHHMPIDGGGVQLFPCSLATSTPQAFLVASWSLRNTTPESSPLSIKSGTHCCPAHIHQVGAGSSLEGVPSLVRLLHLPVSLAGPSPSGSAGPSRRCQGCSRPHPHLRARTALSFTNLLRQVEGGSFHPTRSYGASWRTSASMNGSMLIGSPGRKKPLLA